MPEVSRPSDELLRRFAWTYSVDNVKPLYEAAKQQLTKLGVSWRNSQCFTTTSERLGAFSQNDWLRWIHSVQPDNQEALETLKRFALTCGVRLGEAESQGEDLLQSIVNEPKERMGVELKPWLLPTDRHCIAKLAKACLALRNNNGGNLVLGFEDNGAPSPNPPTDLESMYHIDQIQQIVSKYASEPFAISVEMRESRDQRHPIIVVPSGVLTPVFAKSAISDPDSREKWLIEDDAIYVRPITSNNRVSSSKLRRSDINRLMKVCFDNREADIGAFVRRHLSGLTPEVLQEAMSSFLQSKKPEATSFEYIDEGYNRFLNSLTDRGQQVPDIGFWEVAAVLNRMDKTEVANIELLHRLQKIRRDLSGWPPWTVLNDSYIPQSKPRVVHGKWEALIDNMKEQGFGRSLDFWQIDPAGRFYHVAVLEDDMQTHTKGIAPKTVLDLYVVVRVVTEAIYAVVQMSLELTGAIDCSIELVFRWRAVRGRVLSSRSEPGKFLRRHATADDDQITSDIQVPIDVSESAIPSYVYRAVRPVFISFQGYDIPQNVIEEIASDLLGQRM